MQALIDFDGWRKWKEYAAKKEAGLAAIDPEQRKLQEKEEKAKAKAALTAMFKRPPPSKKEEKKEDFIKKEEEKRNHKSRGSGSLSASGYPSLGSPLGITPEEIDEKG